MTTSFCPSAMCPVVSTRTCSVSHEKTCPGQFSPDGVAVGPQRTLVRKTVTPVVAVRFSMASRVKAVPAGGLAMVTVSFCGVVVSARSDDREPEPATVLYRSTGVACSRTVIAADAHTHTVPVADWPGTVGSRYGWVPSDAVRLSMQMSSRLVELRMSQQIMPPVVFVGASGGAWSSGANRTVSVVGALLVKPSAVPVSAPPE